MKHVLTFVLITVTLDACRLPLTHQTIQTLPHWPDGATDITRHAPFGDAAYDTAIFGDGLIRYPIWHRLNDSVFAIGDDTIPPEPPRPTFNADEARLGAVSRRWFTHYDSLGVYRVRYELHDTLIGDKWIPLKTATQILARPDSNCDWKETRTPIPASGIPQWEDEENGNE